MRKGTIRIALCSAAAAGVLAAASLPGALGARRAASASALESRVLSRDIAFLERRVAIDPHNWLLAGHLADLYARRFQEDADLTDVERAEALARSALALRTTTPSAHARLASILLTQHRFADAYDVAKIAASFEAPGDAALAVFVDAARAVGDYAAADSALARITPGTFAAAVRGTGGDVRRAARRIGRACVRLEELGASRDLRAWCLTRLAGAEHARAGADAAEGWLRRALTVRPTHRGAIESLADMAYAQGEWRRAKTLYTRILADAHPDLFLRLAEVDRALGLEDSAAKFEERFVALATAPGAEALNALPLAMHYARTGRCYDAARLARGELARRRSAEALETVAWIRFECGDTRGAATLLAEADGLADLSTSGQYLDALLLQHRGERAAAETRLLQATGDPTLLDHNALHHLLTRSTRS
jgi:Tfp pilus assembly protein PilF